MQVDHRLNAAQRSCEPSLDDLLLYDTRKSIVTQSAMKFFDEDPNPPKPQQMITSVVSCCHESNYASNITAALVQKIPDEGYSRELIAKQILNAVWYEESP